MLHFINEVTVISRCFVKSRQAPRSCEEIANVFVFVLELSGKTQTP